MRPRLGLTKWLMLFSIFFLLSRVHGWQQEECKLKLGQWAEAQESWTKEEEGNHGFKVVLGELLYFLHIPRTGGRAFGVCFLKELFPFSMRCRPSYDKLRFNATGQPCHLLASHDDASVLSRLPLGKMSMYTNLREPAQRVLSAYEFMVQVSARALLLRHRAMMLSTGKAAMSAAANEDDNVGASAASQLQVTVETLTNPKAKPRSATRRIWPWVHLQPIIEADIIERARGRLNEFLAASWRDAPYNNSDVMPLHQFLRLPVVHDHIFNGMTFQLAGLTNNSILPEASDLRSCVQSFPELGHFVLHVAKARLRSMAAFGLTNEHEASAELFAFIFGRELINLVKDLKPEKEPDPFNITIPGRRPLPDWRPCSSVVELLERYRNCSKRFKDRYLSSDSTISLREDHQSGPLSRLVKVAVNWADSRSRKFTHQMRETIPLEIWDYIRHHNQLDEELFTLAQHLFYKKQREEGLDWRDDNSTEGILEPLTDFAHFGDVKTTPRSPPEDQTSVDNSFLYNRDVDPEQKSQDLQRGTVRGVWSQRADEHEDIGSGVEYIGGSWKEEEKRSRDETVEQEIELFGSPPEREQPDKILHSGEGEGKAVGQRAYGVQRLYNSSLGTEEEESDLTAAAHETVPSGGGAERGIASDLCSEEGLSTGGNLRWGVCSVVDFFSHKEKRREDEGRIEEQSLDEVDGVKWTLGFFGFGYMDAGVGEGEGGGVPWNWLGVFFVSACTISVTGVALGFVVLSKGRVVAVKKEVKVVAMGGRGAKLRAK